MDSIADKIDSTVKELQEKGEEATSYKVAKLLGISESTVYYHWRRGQINSKEKALESQVQKLRKIVQSITKKAQESQDILVEIEREFGMVNIQEENVKNPGENVVTTHRLPHAILLNIQDSTNVQDQDKRNKDKKDIQDKDIWSKQVDEFYQEFREKYKRLYGLLYAKGGYSPKEKSQIQRVLRTFVKNQVDWKEYLNWCFSKKAKASGTVLNIGLISCKSFLNEFLQQFKRKDIPEWLKKTK